MTDLNISDLIKKKRQLEQEINNSREIMRKLKDKKKSLNDMIENYINYISQNMINRSSQTPIAIGNDIYIDAYIVKSKKEIHKNKGYWCYNTRDKRFYTSINGIIVKAKATKILQSHDYPVKTIEYDSNRNNKRTDFYAPPEIYGGYDVRNLSNKMEYVPKKISAFKRNSHAYTIGSIDNFEEDINLSDDKDIRYSSDIAAHFTLMNWLINSYLQDN